MYSHTSFHKYKAKIVTSLLCLVYLCGAYAMGAAHAQAGQVPDHIAIRIIISEAANQGLKGMICVGEVLRYRGRTKGFYGYQSNRVEAQPKAIWAMAAKAWEMSAYTHYTKGANHFENVRAFGKPWWAKHGVITFEYKDHVFYKLKHH